MADTYLFVHQNFPGQFGHLSRALAERGARVVAIGDDARLRERSTPHPRIERIGYPSPHGGGRGTHHYLRGLEGHTRRGQAVYRAASDLATKGLSPNVVIAHPGWGEALFLRDVFPRARHIHYCEFFYRPQGSDLGFDPEFPTSVDDRLKVRVKNATQMISFEAADAGISPTEWQRRQYPDDWQRRIARIHDGIDTRIARPDPTAKVSLGGTALGTDDEVLTYVARNLEPYRGFHVFMRAVPEILALRPNARILIIGADGVSYGRPPESGTYRENLVAAWPKEMDRSRVHFLGRLPYDQFLDVLRISSVHVYLTYPFVLSWSMLEAMSCGCVVLGSATPPVMEVIRDRENGFLADFFDSSALARKAADLLAARRDLVPIREAARATILGKYDLNALCLPRMIDFVSAPTTDS